MSGKVTWKVKMFEVYEDQRPDEKGMEVPGFGVDVDDDDKDFAKAAARKWLDERGKKVRSVSHSAAAPRTLVAVVVKKRAGK